MVAKKTMKNLKDAFAGESQANRKYLAFAIKAEDEGYSQIAKLFRAAADAETVHAHNHLKAMKGIGSTKDNLDKAINGETFEFQEMYPEMIKQAEEENENEARASFNYANKVEKIHAELYKKYLDNMEDLEDKALYVCQFCGNTIEGKPEAPCSICGRPVEIFEEIV